jgi:hypothetical protein
MRDGGEEVVQSMRRAMRTGRDMEDESLRCR